MATALTEPFVATREVWEAVRGGLFSVEDHERAFIALVGERYQMPANPKYPWLTGVVPFVKDMTLVSYGMYLFVLGLWRGERVVDLLEDRYQAGVKITREELAAFFSNRLRRRDLILDPGCRAGSPMSRRMDYAISRFFDVESTTGVEIFKHLDVHTLMALLDKCCSSRDYFYYVSKAIIIRDDEYSREFIREAQPLLLVDDADLVTLVYQAHSLETRLRAEATILARGHRAAYQLARSYHRHDCEARKNEGRGAATGEGEPRQESSLVRFVTVLLWSDIPSTEKVLALQDMSGLLDMRELHVGVGEFYGDGPVDLTFMNDAINTARVDPDPLVIAWLYQAGVRPNETTIAEALIGYPDVIKRLEGGVSLTGVGEGVTVRIPMLIRREVLEEAEEFDEDPVTAYQPYATDYDERELAARGYLYSRA
jgi:hypothetical protein